MPGQSGLFESGLDKNFANYAPLTPLGLLERSATVYSDHLAVVHGERRYTWAQTYERCRRLASALAKRGVEPGDSVAVMAANTPELYEAHFAVPMAGAVLNALNTRLDAGTLAYILEHSESRVLITDREFSASVGEALAALKNPPTVIDIDDALAANVGPRLGEIDYETLLAEGDPAYDWKPPEDEWQAISLNYTSGTTGRPKGVVYHHRGAFLVALGNTIAWQMPRHAVYLWTLPMFHCNGWCFPWTLAAVAGTSVCLRQVTGDAVWQAITEHKVSHFCGAPIVLNMVVNSAYAGGAASPRQAGHQVSVMTAAAPPPAATLERMQRLGFKVTHVYGLTEVYGPCVVCAWQDAWDDMPIDRQAELNARQGVRYPVLEHLAVRDPETMAAVPADGETMGEVMFRGNTVMKGYLKDTEATAAAFAGGWFHSGDLGVTHPDGYIQLKDRSKDIIISGGENISSIEVEGVLHRHPAVLLAAAVAMPDEKWGETPCAFVELKPDADEVTAEELIAYCRANLAHYKCPTRIVFAELPKTSTGKVQKFKLRQQARGA
ncbi:MAG: acyl-CoA synthetase [Rhodospirillales bacterium]|nr:acyl-CoA synthetase [Rhodospirillales bacterium]